MSQSAARPNRPVSDAAFIITCVLLLVIVAIRYTRGPVAERRAVQATEDAPSDLKVALPAPLIARSSQRALIVINPDCVFCQRSIPFYAYLVDFAVRSKGRVEVRFASLQSPERTAPFLHRLSVNA